MSLHDTEDVESKTADPAREDTAEMNSYCTQQYAESHPACEDTASLHDMEPDVASQTEHPVAPEQDTPSFVDTEDVAAEARDAEKEQAELKARRWNRFRKAFIGLIFLGLIVFVIVDATTNMYLRTGVNNFLAWFENNAVAGMFAFMLVYFVATVIFIPGSLLTLAAGFVFANAFGLGIGILVGTLAVFIGAGAGAIVSFALGRYLLRAWVEGLSKRYAIFEALDIALEEKGFRIMALLRLSPIIPFNAINYIAGVTNISWAAYCWTLFAILPGTVLFVFFGASAGSLADSANSGDNLTVTIIVVVVGIVFGVAAVALISIYAKKELNRILEERQAQSTDSEQDLEAQSADSEQDLEAQQDTDTVDMEDHVDADAETIDIDEHLQDSEAQETVDNAQVAEA